MVKTRTGAIKTIYVMPGGVVKLLPGFFIPQRLFIFANPFKKIFRPHPIDIFQA
jgi:hypothetical protein